MFSLPPKFKYILGFAETVPIGFVTTVSTADLTEQTLIKHSSTYLDVHPEINEILFDKAFDTDDIKAILDNMKFQTKFRVYFILMYKPPIHPWYWAWIIS